LFSADFLAFLREVLGADGGTVCQEVGQLTPEQRDPRWERAVANQDWLERTDTVVLTVAGLDKLLPGNRGAA
jgi:hypothetical protein